MSLWNYKKSIGEIYQPKSNAFDVIRFVLASLVLVFHSYILVGSKSVDFLARLTRGQSNFGEFAVGGFFVISGFLITQSLLNSKNVFQYLWKRALRLFPALFVSLAVSAVILGPLITHQSIKDYFLGDQGTSPLSFFLLNFSLNIFGFSYSLRDLFLNNPYPSAVNGSLWTVKHEFASYLILAGLAYFGFIKRPRLLLLFSGFIGLANVAHFIFNISLVSKLTTTWWIFHEVEYPYFLEYFWMFLLGAILFIYRKDIIISSKIFILVLGLVIAANWMGYYLYAWFFFSPYLIIALAVTLPWSGFSKYGDFSYGMYVYAFPVQQTLVYLLYPNLNAKQLMIYAFLITLFLAALSWHYVEKPALNLKNYFNRLKTT